MARRIYLLGPSAVAFAIFGCGGAGDGGLFGASGGASSAGAASVHGAGASSTPPGAGGDTSSAGDFGLGGDDTAGESAGGSSSGGADTGGGNGEAGHSGSGGSVDHAGAGGSAGNAEGGGAGHAEGGGAGHAQGGEGGTAGAGTAGSAGSSGAGAGGGGTEPTCSQLLAEAATELTAARACNLAANAEQCTGAVETVCNCQVPVEKSDSAATKAYEATLKQINAKHCSQVCPAIACFPVTHAQCKATEPGSSKGSCIASFGIPTPVPAF
ncbi:MAG TPA: hypothetical protein VHW01_18330 [Polyangiaceae bacterium]|jgi:hypothetical protein|nr:hypothetical protein [Polyangiaceae bacterium]